MLYRCTTKGIYRREKKKNEKEGERQGENVCLLPINMAKLKIQLHY